MLVVDLSNNQGVADFAAMRRGGIGAVWLKATEGETFTDGTFAARRAAANKAGLRVGAYHFAHPDLHTDPTVEADHFCKVVGKVNRTDLRPVLDYERTTKTGWDEPWIRGWNKHVKGKLGAGPLFYTYPALVPSLRLSSTVGYGLWIASYGRDDGAEHAYAVPRPWTKAVAHQFTSHARVAGCPGLVDLSKVFNVTAVLAHPVTGAV